MLAIETIVKKEIVLFYVQSLFVKKSLQEEQRKLTYFYYNFCSFTTKENTEMIIEEIQAAFPKLRKSEQKAASYMLKHVEEMEQISLGKMAKAAGVSEATVIRMLKAVGYKSFKEIKIAFVEERMEKKEGEMRGILGIPMQKREKIEDVPGMIIQNTISLLQDSLQSISAKRLKEAVRAIEKADRVCIFSVENSNAVAEDLQTKLMYLGICCEYTKDYYLQSIQAGHMKKKEVAIGISYSGTSMNTVDVLKQAKKNGATTIAITNFDNTPLVEHADIVILTSDKQFLYGNDIFSRTIHMAVVDMIYMGLLVDDYEKYNRRLQSSGKMVHLRKYEK